MTKLVLDDVGSTLTNTAATTINNNNNKIEQALENTLSRDGSTPNNMQADLDMDSNDILNVNIVHTDTLILNGETVTPSDLSALPPTVMLKTTYDPSNTGTDIATLAPKSNPLFSKQGGSEGGQIRLEKPDSGSTLATDLEVGLTGNQLKIGDGVKAGILDMAEITGDAKIIHEDNVATNNAVTLAFFGRTFEYGYPSLAQWQNDLSNGADWTAAFNAANAAVGSVSQKGTKVIIPPNKRIEVGDSGSFVNITAHGLVFVGQGRINTPNEAQDSIIYARGGTVDIFRWADGVRGGGFEDCTFHADNRTAGRLFFADGAEGQRWVNIYIKGAANGLHVIGGRDQVVRDFHLEGYKTVGVVIEGTTAKRGDRFNLQNVTIAGTGTESVITATGDALRIIGNWHTVEAKDVRLVKHGRYGLSIESALVSVDERPHYLNFYNLQTDFGNNSAINCTQVQDIKIDKSYFQGNKAGNMFDFITASNEVEITNSRMAFSANRILTFGGGKSFTFSGNRAMKWNTSGSTEAAIVCDTGYDKAMINHNQFGPFGRYTDTVGTAGRLGLFTAVAGQVHYHGNQHHGGMTNPGFNIFAGSTSDTTGNTYV